MSRQSRRQFIKTSAAAATAFSTFTISGTKSSGRVLGANDTINVAVAGIGGRGMEHVGMYKDYEKVRVTWSIDPDAKRAARGKKKAETVGGKAKAAQDVRKALEDKNVDAFSIASCNHWHGSETACPRTRKNGSAPENPYPFPYPFRAHSGDQHAQYAQIKQHAVFSYLMGK